MASLLHTWKNVLESLDMEQAELLEALTTDVTVHVDTLAQRAGRPRHATERILGEALLYVGRRLVDQARAATDGRGR